MIVASVLLALAGDAWWESRRDRADEYNLLASLEAEFVSNLDDMAHWQVIHGRMLTTASDLLTQCGPDAAPIDAAAFDARLSDALMWRTAHPATGALRTAVSRMQLIRSPELRRELGGFQDKIADFTESYDWAVEEVADVISHVQGVVPLYTADNRRWTPAGEAQSRTDLLRDVSFANVLGLWVWRANRMAEESEALEAQMLATLELVRRERSMLGD